jgi:hypothetical protein
VAEEAPAGEASDKRGPLRRTLELCVFAPVGAAMTVAEELPTFVAKGRKRVEQQLSNAHVVGRFVVHKGQRDLSLRLDEVLRSAAAANGDAAAGTETAAPEPPAPPEGASPTSPAEPTTRSDSPLAPPVAPAPVVRPAPDPAVAAIVGGALADYDTLSASQVVRRLESLGPDELRAVQRYEASHRNRRTVLNRAGQLLGDASAGPSA